ncbi:MAG: RDD family protein, partial [Gammaproteobacteria bacterium]|nr:RDD family protein [Gammaproteobacteria bacterium]
MVTDSATTSQPALPSAGLLRRLAALLYDAFLIGAIWMLLGFVVTLFFGPDTSSLVNGQVQTDPVVDLVLFPLMVLSCVGFYLWFWCQSGQTLGMMAWRIKLVSADGQLISIRQGVLRIILAWPAFFLLGLGYLWILLDKNGDAVHDMLT